MLKTCILGATVGGVLCGCATPEPTKLLTYNIQIGLQVDHKTRTLEQTAEVIKKINAETVVLNEVDVHATRSDLVDQPKFVAQIAGYPHYLFGVASLRPGGEYGNVVMSKYPLESLTLLDLPSNDNESRSAMVVKVNAPKPYYIIGTHFTYEQTPEMNEVRVKSVDMIADYIKEHQLTPVVLAGDLNAWENSNPIVRLREQGFCVINDVAPGEASYPADKPKVLLDYMAVYPADVAEVVTHYVVDEPKASDHRPVYSEIIFK